MPKTSQRRGGSHQGKTTTDHDKIRKWAESRGGHPATVKTATASKTSSRGGAKGSTSASRAGGKAGASAKTRGGASKVRAKTASKGRATAKSR